jgi:hypothetical protein
MGIMYATRELVMRSLEVMENAYQGGRIDATILSASRSAEGFLHRRFYPEQRTILKDWPNNSYSPTWEVNLGDQEMISLSAVASGGTTITSDCILRRGDDLAEPPYSTLAVDLTSDSSFSGGSSFQRSLSIAGLFGYSDTDVTFAGAALSGGINSSVTTMVTNPSSGWFTVGIGSLLKVDSERMMVIDRRMSSIGITTTSALLDIQSGRTFTTASASSLAIGEVILIDSERMRIDDIAGTSVIVTRAWDGTVLAEHSSGATIYGLRTAIVRRGILGSTAASHSDAVSIYVHEFPSLLTELVAAESIVMLGVTPDTPGVDINDIRERAWRQLARKGRLAAI